MNKLVIASLLLAGCFKANIWLKPPGGPIAPGTVNGAFHINLIDIIELSPAIDLNAACGGNAVMIHDSLGVVGGIVNLILGDYFPILSVWNATVNCGAGGGEAPPGPAAPGPDAPPPAG
jgi:hypothetical protein